MQSVYKVKKTTKWIGILAGLAFIIVGGGILLSALFSMGKVLGLGAQPAEGTSLQCGGLCISAFCVAGGAAALWAVLAGAEIHLTGSALEQRQRRRVVRQLSYDEITAVRMVHRREARRGRNPRLARVNLYPVVLIEGQSDQPFMLDVDYHGPAITARSSASAVYGRTAPYDTRAILQDLLPRLSSATHVDPVVLNYVQSGQLPDDLTTLPQG
jgi:hypothetical protein